MTWHAYQVILRLRSPLHIGCGKVGNLQRTRPYVTGRVLWGALTMRLTRDAANGRGPANDSRVYRQFGERVHHSLAFTYFYPATKLRNSYQVAWPWLDGNRFRRRFLSSYCGTALAYPHQSAAVGMLHEVEFITPNTLDSGEPVFLQGYIFERDGNDLNWRDALNRLQLGGERGYGWGDTELIAVSAAQNGCLFDDENIVFDGGKDLPNMRLEASQQPSGRLLAHTLASSLQAVGEVEPLVGREWRSDNSQNRHVGQHVAFRDICYAPGSMVNQTFCFAIKEFGVWKCLA